MVYPIREFDNQKLEILATATIGDIAVSYCGADIDLSAGAIRESATLLVEKFSGIGIDEVREAFKLASTKATTANLAAYSGQFTVRLFGEVMAAYIEYRRPAVALMHQQAEIERRDLELKEMASKVASARDAVIEQFKSIIENGNQVFRSYGDIPANWCKILVKEHLIFGDAATWLKAKEIVRKNFFTAQQMLIPDDTLSTFDAKKAYGEMSADETLFSNLLLPRAEVLYGRLLVWNAINKSI